MSVLRQPRSILTAKSSPKGRPISTTAARMEQTSLLRWLIQEHGVLPQALKIERTYINAQRGWGLMATDALEPDEIAISVPWEVLIVSGEDSQDQWAIHMAQMLLKEQAAGKASPLHVWIESLPSRQPLPWLHWDEEHIQELQDTEILTAIAELRKIYKEACQILPEYPPNNVADALSLIYSRSFTTPSGANVMVPGIDSANHSFVPNALVRCVHSPDACQGAAALEEIAPVTALSLSPGGSSSFQLVAGSVGIAAGEEVTISYSSTPQNDTFLLNFGFLPEALDASDSGIRLWAREDLEEGLLTAHPTTLQQDEELLASASDGEYQKKTALQYRMAKKRQLLAARVLEAQRSRVGRKP